MFLGSFAVAIGVAVYPHHNFVGGDFGIYKAYPIWSQLMACLLPLVAVPLLTRLYLKWIGGKVTDAEKASGMEGIRAWLCANNLISALLISLCAWAGFGYSFFAVMALCLAALVAYPVLNMAFATSKSPAPKTEDLSPERERVLKMLDDGKITAPESAELLNALSHTVQPRTTQSSSAAPHRKMVLIGLLLLLIGFFLPWFSINLGQEMQGQMNQMTQQIPGFHDQIPMHLNTGTVNVAGGDIKYGLGWWVLLLGIAVAILPYVATNLDSQTQHKAMLIGLSIGAVILLYLLTQNMRYASVGIILGLAGYVLQVIGTLKERQAALG